MADISVSLELDDSKYKSGISAAERAARQFGTTATSSMGGANQAFAQVANGVDSLNVKFQNLGRVLLGVGLAQFATNIIQSADQLIDMSNALGVNVARLQEMGMAASTAGGNMEGLSNMMSKMEVTIQGAIDGSANYQKALRDVGVTIDDINSKTPDQLFNQIAVALSKVEEPTKRAALSMELFGKAGKMFGWNDYVQGITKVYGSMEKYTEANKQAAELADRFANQMGLIKTNALQLLAPLLGIANGSMDMATAMDRAKTVAQALVGVMALWAGKTVISGIIGIVNAVRSLGAFMAGSAIGTAISTTAIDSNTRSALLNVDAAVFMAGAHGRVGTATTAVAIAQLRLTAAQQSGVATAAELFALENALAQAQGRLALATEAAAVTQGQLTAAQVTGTAAATGLSTASTGLLATLGKFKWVAAAAAGALALLYSSDLNAGEDEEIARINALGKALAGMTKEERDRYNKLSAYEQNRIKDTIIQNSLMKEQANIMAKVTGEGQKPTGNNAFAETPEAKAARERMATATKNEANAIYDMLRAQRSSNDERERSLRFQIDSLSLSEKDRALSQMSERDKIVKTATYEAEKQYLNEISNLQAKIYKYRNGSAEEKAQVEALYKAQKDLRTEYEAHLPIIEDLANKYATLQEARQLNLFTISEEIKRQNQLIDIQDQMAKMTMTEIEKKYYDIEAAARASAKAAVEAEEARRGARLTPEEAQAYYDAALKGTEELIRKQKELYDQSREFSTGWERAFKEYRENATNAAKQAEAIFAKATQGMEDAIVSFAKTGKFEWKSFVSSIVEEMLRQQVRQLIASTFGGIFSGGGASSTKSSGLLGLGGLFGFLASGGPAFANQPYIVGEKGPEVFVPNISGTVVPNRSIGDAGIGGTNVIYNINAVDAMSFKQMVARDPSFIYAVSQQGAKSIPSRRR